MRFIHFADSHIGSWDSVPKLQELGIASLEKVCEEAASQKVDFVIIAGDLFDKPFVGFDLIGRTIGALMKLKYAKIPIYLICGSHDVSVLGESVVDLLEKAEIVVNVDKTKNLGESTKNINTQTNNSGIFTNDAKTQANIIGIGGKRRGLDKFLFGNSIEHPNSYAIFVFHNLVSEILGQEFPFIEGITLNQLPQKFDYYAASHIHIRKIVDFNSRGYGVVVYPGPLFPTNIDELRKLESGSYVIVSTSENKGKFASQVEVCEIKLKGVFEIKAKVELDINTQINNQTKDLKDKIVILTLKGKTNGKQIEIKEYVRALESFEPYCILINNKIEDSDIIKIDYQQSGECVEEIERRAIEEIAKTEIHQQMCADFGFNQLEILKTLMNNLNLEKQDGETNAAFEARVVNIFKTIIKAKNEKSLFDKIGESQQKIV